MHKLTQTEKHLINGLKAFGMDMDETIGIMVALDTPEKQNKMLEWMLNHLKATPSEVIGITMDIAATKN